MKQYDFYKASGIEWIGIIPKSWNVSRLKYEDIVKMGQSPNSEDYNFERVGIPFLQGNADFGLYHPSPKVWCDEATKFAQKHDILISVRAPIGEINIADQVYGVGRGLASITSLKSDNKYLYYLLLCAKKHLNSIGTGSTYTAITIEDVKNFKFGLPTKIEQNLIANFLDIKTAQIDKIISKKEKLLLLLEEEQKVVIRQTITKGINPDVKFKESDVEWLGEIPEHWELRKLSRSFEQISSGTTPKSDNEEYYKDGDINWILTGDLNDSFIINGNKKITQAAFDDHSALKLFPVNTLLIAMYGATIGKVGILKIEACTNQACCALTKSKFFLNEFLLYWFITYKEVIVSLSFGGGQPNISQEIIRSLKVVCPPVTEQKQILSYIHNTNERIDAIKTKIKKEIALLREYKQSIIFEAVTGKIDVREIRYD